MQPLAAKAKRAMPNTHTPGNMVRKGRGKRELNMQNPFRDKIHSTLFVPSFDSNFCNPVSQCHWHVPNGSMANLFGLFLVRGREPHCVRLSHCVAQLRYFFDRVAGRWAGGSTPTGSNPISSVFLGRYWRGCLSVFSVVLHWHGCTYRQRRSQSQLRERR